MEVLQNKKRTFFFKLTLGLSQNGQTRSSSNRGTMPSPPLRHGSGKGGKSSEPLRQFNFNQQRSSRQYNQQSPLAQYDGQDYSYGNQRRARQQDYYNDYVPNRRNNGYGEWPRQSQRFSRPAQNYNENRFYSSRRKFHFYAMNIYSFIFSKVNNQQEDIVIVHDVIQLVVSQIINNKLVIIVNNNVNVRMVILDHH
jgi:hypothetical protein